MAAVVPKESIGEPALAGNETVTATNPAVSSTAATNLAVSSTASVSSTIIPSYSLLSQCPLLGNNVSVAVKGKIVASSYVDFAQLLPVNRLDTNQTQRFQLAFNPDSPNQLLLQQQPVNKLITNIFEWTTAFHTFSAIYLERHPGRAQELLRYAEIIRFACRKFGGFGWRTYDVEFRTQQATNPTRSWATIDGVLWLEIFTPSGSGTSPFRVSSFNRQPSLNSPTHRGNSNESVSPLTHGQAASGKTVRTSTSVLFAGPKVTTDSPVLKVRKRLKETRQTMFRPNHDISNLAPPPIKVSKLKQLLLKYPNVEARSILIDAILRKVLGLNILE